ncbi:MAG: sodium bicarbonate transporter family protein [Polyangiales bacterium]
MSLRKRIHDSEILLDLAAGDLHGLVGQALDRLEQLGKISTDELTAVREHLGDRGLGAPRDLGGGVGVVRLRYPVPAGPDDAEAERYRCALIRVPDGIRASDHEWIHFLWLIVAPEGGRTPRDGELEPFGWMLHDDRFSASILGANDPMQVLATYQLYLEYVEAPPDVRRPSLLPSYEDVVETEDTKFGAGLVADIRRKLPYYRSDFTDGLNSNGLATILFLFFACLAPSVAFGGLLAFLTDGQIGAVEAILATAIGGVAYALFSGQPLTLLGSTGPVTIFLSLLYVLCSQLSVPFLPGLFWIGIWTSFFLLVLALTNASRYIEYFTRFTDEIFGALIAMIFITEAFRDIFGGVIGVELPTSGELLALIIALGTYFVALQLSRVRQKPLLTKTAREFLADFGPAIAILLMTGIAWSMRPVPLEHLAVPDTFATTTGRAWLVDPMEAPVWFWFLAIPIAVLATVLMYLDQNITVRIVNSPQHRLKKGHGYNLDMTVVAVLVALLAALGLPWVVAATVRSLNHVRSLATVEHHSHGEHIISVRENRLTAIVVHLLIGGSLLFLGLLREIPMSVVFGLFLYMGVASLRGNQFIDRLKLWVTDPALYPPTHYIRRVPRSVVHTFTAIQVVCLATLWFVKESAFAVLFPLFIMLLVPVRRSLGRLFNARNLAFLDADENPGEEQFRETG